MYLITVAMAFAPILALLNFFLYQYNMYWHVDTRNGEIWESVVVVFAIVAPMANVIQSYRTGKGTLLNELCKEYFHTVQLMVCKFLDNTFRDYHDNLHTNIY